MGELSLYVLLFVGTALLVRRLKAGAAWRVCVGVFAVGPLVCVLVIDPGRLEEVPKGLVALEAAISGLLVGTATWAAIFGTYVVIVRPIAGFFKRGQKDNGPKKWAKKGQAFLRGCRRGL